MRASRQTELARAFPLHVVTKWLGNTPQIALKHDLQVTNQDFARAWARSLSTGAAQRAAKGLQNQVHQAHAQDRTGEPETTKAPGGQGLIRNRATTGDVAPDVRVARTGCEPVTRSGGKRST